MQNNSIDMQEPAGNNWNRKNRTDLLNQKIGKENILDEEIVTTYDKLPNSIRDSKDWVTVSRNDLQNVSISAKIISQIDSSQLEFNKIIGNGSFGQVWKGRWRQIQVAIKQVKQEIIDKKSTQNMKILNFKF